MFKRLLIIFLLLNTFCQLSAQKYTADVQQLGIEDGLAHRQVLQLFEDKDGFLWIAIVKDLQRYDGYKLKSYDLGKEKNTISTLYAN
jgi:ligand-binding sensor domain-containing protein